MYLLWRSWWDGSLPAISDYFDVVRVFLIGVVMGIADLIPGVSGTIAFITGIYDELLACIQSLRIQNLKKIPWRFLLPLGAGIVASILLFSRLFYFLLLNYRAHMFGFFFGLIAASTLICAKKINNRRKPIYFFSFLAGAILSFTLTILPSQLLFGESYFGILIAAILAAGVMLLPGISGSFLLQLIGVYPIMLYALTTPAHPHSFKVLLTMGIGVALGLMIFSRAISFLLGSYPNGTLAVLVGFMAGGLKALWPFDGQAYLLPLLLIFMGFFLIICIELSKRYLSGRQGVS